LEPLNPSGTMRTGFEAKDLDTSDLVQSFQVLEKDVFINDRIFNDHGSFFGSCVPPRPKKASWIKLTKMKVYPPVPRQSQRRGGLLGKGSIKMGLTR